ncbi:tRNA (adenosine(37)-N6)-dimethylallyltransferase MiaA [Flavitalea sp.]|nr:tRNA (adenosine(37)-N6)-dimethylallyltransferase MiaA [Flavitalea sp.]
MSKTVIIIVGPTAAGKTAIAIRLAQQLKTEIISADSRQCYIEMDIGVAKPSKAELEAVHHYFINSHSIHQPANAADFEAYALNAAEEIFTKHDIAVMVGGTGLYIRSFCEGLDIIPPIDPVLHNEINASYDKFGLEWLKQEVSELDPLFYATGEIDNPHRLLRALEVIKATGHSIRHYQTQHKKQRAFNIIKLGIAPPKPILQNQIDKRVDQMIVAGLVDEVKSLVPYKSLPPLRTVGYTEIFEYLENKINLESAIENIKIHTRQYAKRQITWFKKDPDIRWFQPDDELPIDGLK